MNLTRVALLVMAGCTLWLHPLRAQAPAPWTPDKQYSAEQVITTKNGMTINTKTFVDNGRIRTESSMHGMNMVAIMLPAEKKMYTVLVDQHMVMEMPLSDAKARQMAASTGGAGANFTLIGPDTVDGVATTKYKMTTTSAPQAFFWWINPANNSPVKMSSEDGSFSLVWKNYQAGPQDPSLFQPPAGYQVMQMPAGMGGAGGGGPAPGAAPGGE